MKSAKNINITINTNEDTNVIINATGAEGATSDAAESGNASALAAGPTTDTILIGNTTTFNELMEILRSRPEMADAAKTEQEEKAKEEKEARLREILGEDYDVYMEQDKPVTEALTKAKRRPGAVQLRENFPCIGRIAIGTDGLCEAFANGYAVYDNGDRKTVVWIPDCGSTTYYFGKLRDNEKEYLRESVEIGEDVLGSLPWYNALLIAGENQIERNLVHPKSVGVTSDSEEKDEWDLKPEYRWVCGAHFDNPEEAYIKKEEAEERRRALTEKQREVYVLYYEEGYNQYEIAEMLGIDHTSVRDRLKIAKKTLGKNREKYFHE